MTLLGIDVGGTKIMGGVVSEQGEILHTARRNTPKSGGRELIDEIANLAHELLAIEKVTSVGVCAAGFISSDRKTILATPNIDGLNGVNLDDELTNRIGLPIVLENDANAALWAESRFGAGCGERNLLMLTLGTGVGGGLILNGELIRGEFGVAAELGHLRLIPNGIRCGCGAEGCLEKYASGSALTQQARDVITTQSGRAGKILEKGDGSLNGFKTEHLTSAAGEGDLLALEILDSFADYLGQGLAALSIVVDPAKIIIGGGIVSSWKLIHRTTLESFKANMPFSGLHPFPEIVPAKLGNNAGLVGVADLSRF